VEQTQPEDRSSDRPPLALELSMNTWPDELLSEATIRTPHDMLRRLCWQMRRYEAAMDTPGLPFHTRILIGERWDKIAREYRTWFEITELASEWKQRERLFLEILHRLDHLEAQQQQKGKEHHDT
jgi:hypothetical protein